MILRNFVFVGGKFRFFSVIHSHVLVIAFTCFSYFTPVYTQNNCIEFTSSLPDKTIECSAPLLFDQPSAIDICCSAPVFFLYRDSVIVEECQQTIIRIWDAATNCGNRRQITQTITRVDNSPPDITAH